MFLSEYLVDKKVRELNIKHEWVFPKPNKKYGYDLIIDNYRIEVKECNPSPQKRYYKNKQGIIQESKDSVRINLQKHGIKEDKVDFYIILIKGTFYVIPAISFKGISGINLPEKKFDDKYKIYKEAWDVFN